MYCRFTLWFITGQKHQINSADLQTLNINRQILLTICFRKMSRNTLSTNQELRAGDFLLSNNRQFKATFQDDGNFVVYGWKPLWASNTAGKSGKFLIMQEDGNLVIYNNDAGPVWASDSWQGGQSLKNHLTLHDDGRLTVRRDCKVCWTVNK
ncbi:mannose-specific lectin-like [Astyanax mexicanus]|uniref:Mannose-specific lectin-like n=1 Tax=Astyanax mexicanus TaxID=7994 RepID=A0A8T2KSK0_ASTMX|nr:mannose-specific lectin-like [Astyanax mexicanus]